MPPPDDNARLQHMLDAARTAVGFVQDRQPDDLIHDLQLALAVVKAIEIVGEAATQVSEDTRARYPHLPWDEMRGIRNRLVHAYFDINYQIVWTTTTKSLPSLIRQLETILECPEDQSV